MTTMTLLEITKEGLRIARTEKSLWLYGFFVGLGAAARSSQSHAPGASHALSGATVPPALGVLIGLAALLLIVVAGFMYFVSEGALIEGVTRVRRGRLTT